MHRETPETSRPEGLTKNPSSTIDGASIFGASPIEDTTTKERAIYVNMARCMVLMGPPSTLSRLVTFSDVDTHVVLFPHNDVLVITLLIGNCRVSKILIDAGNNINFLYEGALDRMEDTLELAWAMINPQTSPSYTGLMEMRLSHLV